MEQRLTEAFDALHMEERCMETIEAAMNTKSENRSFTRPTWRRFAAVAACLVLVAACITVPAMARSTNIFEDFLAKMIDDSEFDEIEEVKHLSSNHVVVKDKDGSTGSFSVAGPADFLEESDGRLYFTANGEHIDITDKISYEEPFIYIYTDEEQIIHYIAVGGVYDPDPAKTDHGWCEYFQNAPGTEPFNPLAEDGWIAGGGQNEIDCDAEKQYPWSVKALEEFDTPWGQLIKEP